jgi:glycine hydroxymethyltransferase
MYTLRRFYGPRFDRINAIIDSVGGHITSFVNVAGNATLPLPEVCEAQGWPATACRAEGHRDARIGPATGPMDEAEALIEDRVRDIFGLDDAYEISGQPHSATQANQIVLRATLGANPQCVAGLSPADGGHVSLSRGLPPGATFAPFPLSRDGLDYEAIRTATQAASPTVIAVGATSFTRGINWARLREIADEVGAHLHADLAHTAPFVAAGLQPPAFPFVDSATLDINKNLHGPKGGILIYRAAYRDTFRRATFPLVQTSPNTSGLLSKAACLSYWTRDRVAIHAASMVHLARTLSSCLSELLGEPIFGTTDSHLLLFNVSAVCGDGQTAEAALERAHILVNRNQVPGDLRSPWSPSGIRLGTAALAFLGYTDEDVGALGAAICSVLMESDAHKPIVTRLLETYHRPLVSIASEAIQPTPIPYRNHGAGSS